MTITVTAQAESWPITGSFTIARGSRTEAIVVVAEISDSRHRGRGECVPYPRYGESVDSVLAEIDAVAPGIVDGSINRATLQSTMKPGAARNALDCAIWDFEAKRQGKRAWTLAGHPQPRPVTTAFTISLGSIESMAEAAGKAADRPLLKVKLGGRDDHDRIKAVRAAAPLSEIIVDANEGWSNETVESMLRTCADCEVTLVEQPLPAGKDQILDRIERPVPVCADESVHDRQTLHGLIGRYDAINIKLDKTGGLTEALALAELAMERELIIMAGCMVGTSLAMAPALIVAQYATVVDLDGPLLLKEDRITGLAFDQSTILPPTAALWG